MDQKKYWQSFAERTGSEELKKASQDEFKDELVVEDASGKGLLDATAPRRARSMRATSPVHCPTQACAS